MMGGASLLLVRCLSAWLLAWTVADTSVAHEEVASCAASKCESTDRGAPGGLVLLQKATKRSKTAPVEDLDDIEPAPVGNRSKSAALSNASLAEWTTEPVLGGIEGPPFKMVMPSVTPARDKIDTNKGVAGTRPVSLASQPQPAIGREAKKAMEHSDEPNKAPSWGQCLLLFVVFAFGIFITMAIILALLQLVVNWVQRKNEQRLARLDKSASAPAAPRDDASSSVAAKPKKTKDEVAKEMSADELASFMNGDHTRLETLLSIASSNAPEAKVQQLCQKASTSYKLKLSSKALDSASTGILALMKAVQLKQKTRTGSFNAKQKLQQAARQVLTMVKMSRAFKKPLHTDHEEQSWTADHGHSSLGLAKYDAGHKDSLHGKFRDTRLRQIENSRLAAYFASESWIDHTAIGFVFLYSQICAFVYAMYLMLRFPKMYAFMGPWLLVSRGEAMAAIVLSTLMVVLLSRGLLTALRHWMSWSTVLQTIADKSVLIHRYIGMMLVFCAVLHIIGHLRGSIPAIVGETDTSKINAAFTYGTKIKFNFNTWQGAMKCYPAVTGYLLVLILIAFWALSNEKVRRKSFELFHYPHIMLVFLWCAALIAHGWKQWLGVGVPLGSLSVAPVLLYYAVERLTHISRGSHPKIRISNAIIKKRTVMMEIDTGSTGFTYDTGMYCMLKVPAISNFEWHPFTIASGAGHHKFQVLFAVVGDWTTCLKDLIKEAQSRGTSYPTICVRGGYGAPAEGMKDKEHIMMVGGGVGATPFLSFLSNITHSVRAHGTQDHFENLKSAAFFWVSREPDDFVWVSEYASIVKSAPTLKDRVSIHLCLTTKLEAVASEDCGAPEVALFWSGVQIALTKLSSDELRSELGVPTQFGRPNWQREFTTQLEALRRRHAQIEEVSVFACGNRMLVDSLEEAGSVASDENTKFRLFAEEF